MSRQQPDPQELVNYDLTKDERYLLGQGLLEWGGPAQCTQELAEAMGFGSWDDLIDQGYRLATAIKRGQALTRLEWAKVGLATEIVFASNVVGSGLDWTTTTGLSDTDTVQLLRALQLKMVDARSMIGNGLGTRDFPLR